MNHNSVNILMAETFQLWLAPGSSGFRMAAGLPATGNRHHPARTHHHQRLLPTRHHP